MLLVFSTKHSRPQVLTQTDRRVMKETIQIRPGCQAASLQLHTAKSLLHRVRAQEHNTWSTKYLHYMSSSLDSNNILQQLCCISLCFPRWPAPRSLCCLALLSIHIGSEQMCPSISLLMSGSQQKCSHAQGDASCFEAQRQGSPVSSTSSCRPQAPDAASSRSLGVYRQPWFN